MSTGWIPGETPSGVSVESKLGEIHMSITQTIANDLVLDIDLAHHERTTALVAKGPTQDRNLDLIENVARAAQRTSAANFLTLWVEGNYEDDGRDTYERNINTLKRLARAIWKAEWQSTVTTRQAHQFLTRSRFTPANTAAHSAPLSDRTNLVNARRALNSFVIEQFTALTASEYGCSRSTAQRGVVRAFEIIAQREGGDARELLNDFNVGLGNRLIDTVDRNAV